MSFSSALLHFASSIPNTPSKFMTFGYVRFIPVGAYMPCKSSMSLCFAHSSQILYTISTPVWSLRSRKSTLKPFIPISAYFLHASLRSLSSTLNTVQRTTPTFFDFPYDTSSGRLISGIVLSISPLFGLYHPSSNIIYSSPSFAAKSM